MNVDNQIIIGKKAGQSVNPKLFEKVLARKPNAFGFVCQTVTENGKPELQIVREDGSNLGIAELEQLMKNAHAFNMALYFANLKDGYNPEDIQPFILKDGDDNPFMSLLIEGTINGHDDPDDRTEQYNLVANTVIPKIIDWCNDFEGELSKIMGKITGDVFKRDLHNYFGHRAVMHIVPYTGDAVTIGKNELGGEYNWGFTTQTLDFDKITEVAKEIEKPKASLWSFGGKKVEASADTKTNPDGVHTVKDKSGKISHDEVKQAKSEGSYPASGKKEPKEEKGAVAFAARPPFWCKTNDDVKMWYKAVHGEVISAWKKRIPVTVKNMDAAKIDNLKDLQNYVMQEALKTTGTTETAIPMPATAPETVNPEVLPIIEPKALEKVLDYVAKHLDSGSKTIPDPATIAAMETEHLRFSSAVGAKVEEMLNWPVSGLFGIAKTDPRAMVLFALEFRALYRALKNGTTIKDTEKSTTKTTVTGNTTKVESVSKEKAPEPKKEAAKASFSLWGNKKAA